MLKFENVHKHFTQKKKTIKALDGVSFSIPKGQIMGIIGQSGAGKSTLIRCANLLEKPSSGHIYVEGESLAQLDIQALRARRQKIGMIFQSFNLLETKTAFENVALPLKLAHRDADIPAKVSALLERVGMSGHAGQYPATLSGGQKQRIAIARALALDPSVLLCDEATSALDPETTDDILSLLLSLKEEKNLSILLITHEMEVAKKMCDHVGILENGKLIEQGTVLDIFARPNVPTTKRLVISSANMQIPDTIQSRLTSSHSENADILYQFTYVGDATSEPLLSILSTQYKISVNILLANIETIKGKTLGRIMVLLRGDLENIYQGLQFLGEHDVQSEKLGYVNRTA